MNRDDIGALLVPTAEWVGLDVDEDDRAAWVREFEPPTTPTAPPNPRRPPMHDPDITVDDDGYIWRGDVALGTVVPHRSTAGEGAIAALRARLAAPQLLGGMVQVGWAGPEMSELAGPLYIDDYMEPGEVVVDEEETESGTLRWTVNVGDWALRHEDGQNDLVDPWPVYGRRSDVPGEGTR